MSSMLPWIIGVIVVVAVIVIAVVIKNKRG